MGMSPELESKSHARVDSSDCIEKMDDRFYGLRRIIRKWGADFRIWPFDCTESSRNHWPGTPRPMTHSLEHAQDGNDGEWNPGLGCDAGKFQGPTTHTRDHNASMPDFPVSFF
jgi:hypothetical protein